MKAGIASNNLSGIRFGVLLNSVEAEAWQAEAINHLVSRGAVLDLAVMDATPFSKTPWVQKLWHYDYSRLLFNLCYRFLFRPKALQRVSVASLLSGAGVMHVVPVSKGISNYLPPDAVEAIRSRDLHFLLRFGFGIVKGDVLLAARHGVWSFHHGDEQLYRGSPPGLWEIMHGDPVTGVMLQRLTQRLDDGEVLHKGWFRTINRSWSDHIDQLLWGAADWPARCAAALSKGQMSGQPARSSAPLFRPPRNLTFAWLLLKMMVHRLAFHYSELFSAEDWNIALKPANKPDAAPVWFPKPSRHIFVADPFLVTIKGEEYIWFEEYDCRLGKGHIASVAVSQIASYPASKRVILSEPWHLSFPSPVTHDGEIFCIPEAFSSGQIRLYRFDESLDQLVFDTVLVDNFPGVDPMLWNDGERWWLFCTSKEAPSIHLFVFYSDNLRGPYHPHLLNPVKSDLRGSRPAGPLFFDQEKLIRPAQDCSIHYGRRVVLNQVQILTPDAFREAPTGYVEPDASSPFGSGLHTYGKNRHTEVFDGKRFVFVSSVFRAKFVLHFKRLFRHV